MGDLIITCVHTGKALATISRRMDSRGDQAVRAEVEDIRGGVRQCRLTKSFPVDPLSPAVATYRAQVWIESILDETE